VDLPEPVALKFGAYTLACHHFTARLPDLGTATQSDTRRTVESLCGVFDEALADFFQRASPADLPEAAAQLGGLLRGQADLFRRTSPTAAAVFDAVVAAMVADAPVWDYRADVQRLHDLGRALACRFYVNSPHVITKERCRRTCPLEFVYDAPDEEDNRPLISAPSLDYSAAPVAFRPRRGDIVVRFTFKHDLALYLAYPFLFLHEYTAHVYATDHGNDRFNDGWMLHAADAFLRRHWKALDPLVVGMSRQQITVFYDRLYVTIQKRNPIAARACRFARDFEATLPDPVRGWFDAITYELAAFEPVSGRRRSWPTDFLNRLEQEFDYNRPALYEKLGAVVTAQELYTILALA
jgi:hypothetical protein